MATPPTPLGALLALGAGATFISFSAVIVRVSETESTTQGVYRVLLGGLMLLAVAAASRREGFADLPARRLAWLFVAGLFFALDLFVWHRSIHLVGPGLATLLGNFQVFLMAGLAAILLRERLSPGLTVAIPIAFVGLTLIVGFRTLRESGATQTGVIYGLMTAVFYAGYLLSLQKARRLARTSAPVADLAIASLVSAVLLGVAAWVERVPVVLNGVREWGYMLAYALVAQVIGWGLITFALPRLRASVVGLVLLLQPILSFVWDVLFFQRAFGWREGLGASLALGAIYYGSRARAQSLQKGTS